VAGAFWSPSGRPEFGYVDCRHMDANVDNMCAILQTSSSPGFQDLIPGLATGMRDD
jgi:hypothetical protein